VTVRFNVGVSGFSYPSWKGTFYEKSTKSEEFLSFYSQRLNSVEINSSFYAPPREAMVKGWVEKTGEEFVFAFKAPQLVTHILKLGKGSVEAAERFSKTLELLGLRRGPVLFQLPPYMKQNLGLLQAFLEGTSKVSRRVFEFRHESWMEAVTYRVLEEHGAGFCIAETEDMKPVTQVSGGLAYFRLRKDSYDDKAIDSWVPKIRKAADGLAETYVYLRHDETGENAIHAQSLAKKLEDN